MEGRLELSKLGSVTVLLVGAFVRVEDVLKRMVGLQILHVSAITKILIKTSSCCTRENEKNFEALILEVLALKLSYSFPSKPTM